MKKVICISDTHGAYRYPDMPEGDILIHAGDITRFGGVDELEDFNDWLGTLPYKDKVVIAGNHDAALELQSIDFARRVLSNAHYLQDEEITVQGIRIYGSPWTPRILDWFFMLPRGSKELRAKWDKIPSGLDILVTHGPPLNKLDYSKISKSGIGCGLLREAVERVRPKYHVFGHAHGNTGGMMGEHTTFINCSIMDSAYFPSNSPIDIEV